MFIKLQLYLKRFRYHPIAIRKRPNNGNQIAYFLHNFIFAIDPAKLIYLGSVSVSMPPKEDDFHFTFVYKT